MDEPKAMKDRAKLADSFATEFPAALAQYSQFKIVDWFLKQATTLQTPVDSDVREALEATLLAWDSLPIGSHSNRTVNNWLNSDQWENAIKLARAALAQKDKVKP